MTQPVTRIICIGNSLMEQDAAGPRVFRDLSRRRLPAHVELVDGGLAGLDLLGALEGCARVVFVDAMAVEFLPAGVYHLDPREVAVQAAATYDHAAGLGYLLRVMPAILGDEIPEIQIIGVQGNPGPDSIRDARRLVLQIALQPMNSARKGAFARS